MFKIIPVVVFLFYLIPVRAQTFRAGLTGGISTSQVAGDTHGGFHKAGIKGGAFSRIIFSEKWNVQFEIIYIQKGSKKIARPEKGDLGFYLLKLNYIEVPLLVKRSHGKFMYEAGPGFGVLIYEEEYNEMMDLTGMRPCNKTEISFNIGINFKLNEKIDVNCRYTNSLLPIREHASGATHLLNRGQYNQVLSFSLYYQL